MENRICINVILPLRLEWEPYYYAEPGVTPGTRVNVTFAGKKYIGVTSAAGVTPNIRSGTILPVDSVSDLPPIGKEELELWRFIADYYLCTIGEVYKCAYPSFRLSSDISETAKKKDNPTHNEGAGGFSETDGGISLSTAQESAYNEIKRVFASSRIALLRGVTGSGKTEIYTKLAAETLRSGRNVLYLVPEIALSRQLEDRLKAHLGESLLVFHSGITIAARKAVNAALRRGKDGYVVLGTRSALFLPHRNLGLVIVDEEHDSSYKQDSPAPRYNGRDTAVMLGNIHKAGVVLGSATPSLESLHNCETGRYSLVNLSERFYGDTRTTIEIVDTIAERRKRGMVGSFSRKLLSHIHDALESGNQIVILRGRRSYSPMVQCVQCGDIPKCPHCNVSLSYHKASEKLVCHYCGHNKPYTGKCPKCGGELAPFGAGTQKIEEEAKTHFPDARIARLDSDTAQNRKLETQIIKDFSRGKIDILIGTQIVSKGFDFEGLSLVAVMQADTLLGQADFRADEKALQLLEQFRGRCGRRGGKGLFVIQTARPEHPVYRQLWGCTEEFSLLAERKEFGYPPYSRIINIVIKDGNLARIGKLSSMLSGRICSAFGISPSFIGGPLEGQVSLTGPYAPSVDRIADEHIRHIRIRMRKDRLLFENKRILAGTIAAFGKEMKYTQHISIDVDPS